VRTNTILLSLVSVPALLLGQPAEGNRINRGNLVISEPGVYFVDRNITANPGTPAIDIVASNVTLNLNGFTVGGPGGKNGTGIRIRGAQSVKVMNGAVQNFAFNVMVANSSNVTIAGLSIRGEGLPIIAPPPETAIMIVHSRGVVVEDNNIFNVGLGVFVRGGRSWGNRIANNTITSGANGALGICYNPADDDPQGPRGDVVSGNHIAGFGTGISFSASSVFNVVQGNTIAFRTSAMEILSDTNKVSNNVDVKLP